MVGAKKTLSPQGDLFIAREISEGMGRPEYVVAQQKLIELGADGFLESIKQNKLANIDEWQTEMPRKTIRNGELDFSQMVYQYTTKLSLVLKLLEI